MIELRTEIAEKKNVCCLLLSGIVIEEYHNFSEYGEVQCNLVMQALLMKLTAAVLQNRWLT